jgi:tripartite-type tricarboxylate transporter receptor subunit TctC
LRQILFSFPGAELAESPFQKALDYIYSFVDFERQGPGVQHRWELKRIEALLKRLGNPQLKARFEKMQFIVSYKSPTEQKKMVSEEYERAVRIADKVGLRKKD